MKYSEIYKTHQGKVSDKWDSYLNFYDKITEFRVPNTILEIGVQNGGSLEIWAKKFPLAKAIVGIDIDEKCSVLEFEDERIKVLVGDAGDSKTEIALLEVSPSFDLIIDDGSHVSTDIISAVIRYLPLLNHDGTFVIEDLHASYWPSWGGGLAQSDSAMNFLKRLADVINLEHWDLPIGVEDYLGGFAPLTSEFIDAAKRVREISFENSMCVLYVGSDETPVGLGLRTSAGTTADVVAAVAETAGQTSVAEMSEGDSLPMDFLNPFFTQLESQKKAQALEAAETFKQELQVQQSLYSELESENAGLVAENAGLVAENEGLAGANKALLARQEEIMRSRLWRATSFLRR